MATVTPDPTALRALSHPVRLRMLGLLRIDGPATATTLATRLGINTGATSYHLRQLAQHGFVIDDPDNNQGRGTGRERWWKAAHQSTRTARADDPAERDAEDAFGQAVTVIHTEQMQRATEERALLSQEWRAATTQSDWSMRLTPARAQALVEHIDRFLTDHDEDADDEPGAEHFTVVVHAFPRPGTVAGDPW